MPPGLIHGCTARFLFCLPQTTRLPVLSILGDPCICLMRPLHRTAICSSASFYLHYIKCSGHILTFREIFCTFLNADKHFPASNARSTKRWMECFTPSNPLRGRCHHQAEQRISPGCFFTQQDRCSLSFICIIPFFFLCVFLVFIVFFSLLLVELYNIF